MRPNDKKTNTKYTRDSAKMTIPTPPDCYKNNHDSNIIRLFIIRHGQTDNNVQKILQGHRDTNLNATGIEQGLKLGKYMYEQHITFDFVASSDLKRCKETTMCVLKEIKHDTANMPPVEYYPALRERYMGVIEGMHITEAEKYADKHGKGTFKEFGEKPEDFVQRLSQQVVSLCENAQPDVQNMAVVSHGGAIRALLSWFDNIDSNAAAKTAHKVIVFNTSVTVVDYHKDTRKFTVEQMGMTQHLGDGEFVVSDLRLR